MSFCTDADVMDRLDSIKGKNFGKTDVQKRIARAERFIQGNFLPVFPTATVTGWSDTTPNSIKDLCADLAALIVKKDYISDYKTSTTEKEMTFGFIKDVAKGLTELLNNNGTIITRRTGKFNINTESVPRDFTIYYPDSSNWGEGSLDDFGPPPTSDENYLGQNA